ncbi:uncharacterized protein LOC123699880 [Colias croceus]|uniref:uncharacterized protein LOC123699880 n=1 Tax=Colias crocea TaxID=72248 RepID=UPI001E27CD03|nr:uncharacterized protein LOC123699880 [Colias croceus]
MKAALIARGSTCQWTDELPTVLLGLRTAIREDNNLSPAMMTYGTTLRMPSDFFVPTRTGFVYVYSCIHTERYSSSTRAPLTPPYDGPYEVLKRYDKYYQIQLPLRTTVVSIDRLKPAYILNEEVEGMASTAVASTPTPTSATSSVPATDYNTDKARPYTTRSGRVVKKNVRFA